MKLYRGIRGPSGVSVTVRGEGIESDLNPRLDLRRHSPTGFEWGYGWSGPAQLALAVLADATRDDAIALALYHDFKCIVALLPQGSWELFSDDVWAWVRRTRKAGGEEVEAAIRSNREARANDEYRKNLDDLIDRFAEGEE